MGNNKASQGRRKRTGKATKETAIAYQNKDIASKIMIEQFKGKTFAVYGIDVPEIVSVRPTNLPSIEVNELRLDDLFLLADGCYAIVDYESRYVESNKNKYVGYVARVLKKLYNELGYFPKLRLIIIYTADVRPGTTNPILDVGCMRMELTEAFLIGLDSKGIYDSIREKLDKGYQLEDDDLMKLIIYPLTSVKNEDKQKAIRSAMDLVEMIEDEPTVAFVYKCLLAFTDKVIDKNDAEEIRRRLGMMTKVEQIIEREKIEAVEAERRKADERIDSVLTETAMKMLENGADLDMVKKCVNLPEARLKELREQLLSENR